MSGFFDPHIHMYSRTTDDYDAMSKAGIEVIVQPSFWLGGPRTFVGTFIDYWEHLISFETIRAKQFGIEHFVCISVNPKESAQRPLALDALQAMLKFIDRERVVAIGEIGYNLINELEEDIFIKQLDIASTKKIPVMIHLPHENKTKGIERIEEILNQNGNKYDRKKILIDHNTEETIKKTLEMGLWAGLSVYPLKKLSLDIAIKEIAKIGYKGVEILCDIPHAYPPEFSKDQAKKIRNLISDLNIGISNLNAFTLYAIGDVYHPSWIENDNKLREIRVKHTIDCIYLAKNLGAKNLSTEPGGPINVKKNKIESNILLKIFADGLKKVKSIAEENDVKILVEPEPSLLIENSQQFLQLMKTICSDYIKLNFDIGHFYCVKEDPSKTILKLIDYIEHFHLSDIANNRVHYHLIPGIGSIDFEQVFDTIKKIGYKGFVTVELYPYQDNPVYVAKQAYNYLKVFI